MSDENPNENTNPDVDGAGERQDPAEPNKVETEVETDKQAEPAVPTSVEVAAEEPVPATTNVHGKAYTVDPDRGYRAADG